MKKNFSISIIASSARAGLGFVFFWLLSRSLGVKDLGNYIYIIAALGYFGTIIDFGFNLFVLNTASRAEGEVRPLLIRVMLAKLVLTVLSVTMLAGFYGAAFAQHGMLVTALFFLVTVLQSFSGTMLHFFKALGRFDHEFASTLMASVLQVLAVTLLHDDPTLTNLAWIVLAVWVAVLVFQLSTFIRITSGQAWTDFHEAVDRRLPRVAKDICQNFKYAIFSVFGSVFLSIDIVIMHFVLGPDKVSIYGTAMKIILACIIFFEVINGLFTPKLAKLHAIRSDLFSYEVKRFFIIMASSSVLLCLAVFVLGPTLISWAFGPDFATAGPIVRILCVIFVLRVAEMTTGPLLTIYGLQAARARVMVAVLPIHIALNLLLQPQFGISGAVGALAFSFLLLLTLNTIFLMRHTPWPAHVTWRK